MAGDGIFPFLCLDQIPGIKLRQQKGKLEVITSFVVYVRIMVYVYFGPWIYFSIDPICCKFCMVLSMFSRMILANPLAFLFETST